MVAQFKTTIHKEEGFFRLILYKISQAVYANPYVLSPPKISRLFIPDYVKCFNYFYTKNYLIKNIYNLRNSYDEIRYFCAHPTINSQK